MSHSRNLNKGTNSEHSWNSKTIIMINDNDNDNDDNDNDDDDDERERTPQEIPRDFLMKNKKQCYWFYPFFEPLLISIEVDVNFYY